MTPQMSQHGAVMNPTRRKQSPQNVCCGETDWLHVGHCGGSNTSHAAARAAPANRLSTISDSWKIWKPLSRLTAVAQPEDRHCEERRDEAIQGSAHQAAVRRFAMTAG
jgi:hypothetical protein